MGSSEASPSPALERPAPQDVRCAFGPSFFRGQLAALVRDRCPEESERLPRVTLWLGDGETLEVCRIAGVSPRWVALAVRGQSKHGEAMPLVLAPYEAIARVRVADPQADHPSIGFDCPRAPTLLGTTPLARAGGGGERRA